MPSSKISTSESALLGTQKEPQIDLGTPSLISSAESSYNSRTQQIGFLQM